MLYSTSASGISSFNLGTPVILSLALGRVATFAADGLMWMVGLRATTTAQHVCLIAMLCK